MTTVLPAEYGFDPTSVGRLLRLKQMGEIKAALAKEAAPMALTMPRRLSPTRPRLGALPPAAGAAPSDSQSSALAMAVNWHEMRVTLRPGEGKEVKLVMRRGLARPMPGR